MLKTRLCEVLGIEVPIILAPMGSATSAEFAAAARPPIAYEPVPACTTSTNSSIAMPIGSRPVSEAANTRGTPGATNKAR